MKTPAEIGAIMERQSGVGRPSQVPAAVGDVRPGKHDGEARPAGFALWRDA